MSDLVKHYEGLIAERDADLSFAVALLTRIRQWDMLDVTGDGSFWKREIDAALLRLKP